MFVTVNLPVTASCFALNAATGATLWGPIALAGDADATYDDGTLFVVSNTGMTSAVISALDPATGNSEWSATVERRLVDAGTSGRGGRVVYTVDSAALVRTAYDEPQQRQALERRSSGNQRHGRRIGRMESMLGAVPTTFDLQP